MLRDHRGYDPGALEIADIVAGRFGTAPYYSTVTRLLVDLNRSPGNPRRFSAMSRRLTASSKKSVMDGYYWPYRLSVEAEINRILRGGENVLHLSVHTFTPVLGEKVRSADIGLLYDSARRGETLFCRRWKRSLLCLNPSLNVRLNYPYSGSSDGFTTYLRSVYNYECYLGVELEVNQKYVVGGLKRRQRLMHAIVDSLSSCLEESWQATGERLED